MSHLTEAPCANCGHSVQRHAEKPRRDNCSLCGCEKYIHTHRVPCQLSVIEQLQRLVGLANDRGLYDAADVLMQMINQRIAASFGGR